MAFFVGIAVIPASAQKSGTPIKTSTEVKKAPPAVARAFQQQFADASGLTWHKMASGNWFAAFSADSMRSRAEYTPEGQWVATRTACTEAALPDTVLRAVSERYPGAAIAGILRIQRADVPPYYQIALQEDDTQKNILANDAGSITE